MKKGGILNRDLNEALAGIGHGDIIMIVDAGFPIPNNRGKRIDLAITKDYPDICKVLEAITGDFIYEACFIAEEQKQYNPKLYSKISTLILRCKVSTVPHTEILQDISAKASVFVRTGSFEPWGNIVLYSGIDAPAWFSKDGVIVPDSYKERAEYKYE